LSSLAVISVVWVVIGEKAACGNRKNDGAAAQFTAVMWRLVKWMLTSASGILRRARLAEEGQHFFFFFCPNFSFFSFYIFFFFFFPIPPLLFLFFPRVAFFFLWF